MTSHPDPPASGRSLLLCLAPLLLPLVLGSFERAEGASFRDHRLRGSEFEPPREPAHRSPDQDMLKALRHIESLRHRTPGASPLRPQRPALAAGYDGGGLLDEAQAIRAMLTLAAPQRGGQAGGEGEERPGWQRQGAGEGEGEEEGEEEWEDNQDQGDKTQEWFQAVLRALEQTEAGNTAHRPAGGARGGRPRLSERAAASHDEAARLTLEGAGRAKGAEEEEEEEKRGHAEEMADGVEEEEEEEEEGGEGGERGIPFVRRAGEGVGEKYTPQKLATLQSIFDEVERMANGGGRQEEEEEEEVEGLGGEGQKTEALSARSLAYDDVARGLADWAPLQLGEDEEVEGEDEEEEQRGSRAQADQVLDYSEDGEEEEEGGPRVGVNDKEQDAESLSAKRSTDAQPAEDADDMANLVDYYLMKVLEKTEEEDKREIDEEEKEEEEEEEEKERAERKISQFQYWDNRAQQQDMQQLIRLSQKYQIPPEDLVSMLQAGDRSGLRSHMTPYKNSGLARAQNKMTQKQAGFLGTRQFNRNRTPDRQSSYMPKDARKQEILNILGLGSVGSQNPAPLLRPQQYKVAHSRFQPQPRRQEKYTPSQVRVAPNKFIHDDNVGEDELAAYLAAKILAKYPAPLYNQKTGQKRSTSGSVWRDEDAEQGALGSFEQAMQDYFDQMASDRVTQQQKRQSDMEDMGGEAQMQIMDDDALMKMMSFLNPEGEMSEEK